MEIWRELVPRFEYRLDNLTAEREEALRARAAPPVVVLTWLLLRSGASEQLAVLMENWRPVLAQVLVSPEGPEGLRAAAHYLYKVGAVGALDALWSVLDSMNEEPRAEELRMPFKTPALEEARVKGVAEGQAQGLADGLSMGVLRILASRGISVDETTRQRILSCRDLPTLDRWFERALKATRIADLEDPEQHG